MGMTHKWPTDEAFSPVACLRGCGTTRQKYDATRFFYQAPGTAGGMHAPLCEPVERSVALLTAEQAVLLSSAREHAFSGAQIRMLKSMATAGEAGMVVPGTLGTTARILRDHFLVEMAPEATSIGECWCGTCAIKTGVPGAEVKCLQRTRRGPPRQRVSAIGRAYLALLP